MASDPRTYLLDRFRGDAHTLRARAAQLAGSAPPAHGPDAEHSRRMAEACDAVTALLEVVPEPIDEQLDALEALGPRLEARASRAGDGFVRSVYAGAAARVVDIVAKERAADLDDAAAADDRDSDGDSRDDADRDE